MPALQGKLGPAPVGERRGNPHRRSRRHRHGENGNGATYAADLHRRPVPLNAEEQQTLEQAIARGREQRAADGVPLAPSRWRAP
jgi:hypothetical protein